ncbi:hypothetical protein [Nocardiopsis synnemataformans]|uniref:hypothetical protein n=1 Tax=Nocardiopsis synnemataformans TaxID=61305 RepID=UPI003EB6C748
MSYYRIDWDALNALPDAEKMQALADIFDQIRSEIGAERGRMVHQSYADHGTQKAAAAALGMKPARFGQIYNEHKESKMKDDTKVTRVAYDFGNELHVMDIDAAGVWVEGTDEVLPMDGDRDETLEGAGYRTVGEWTRQGEADGITVERA